ncbi:MAG: DCC1-like thiol-disulfide oxidoreductase family protein [Gemmatimonadota bacterium]|nr:DCC1-like thiol-disulfide oxidoreductase family protein [Gemmatimonadota bacterium]
MSPSGRNAAPAPSARFPTWMPALHATASAESLAMARIGVFAVCVVQAVLLAVDAPDAAAATRPLLAALAALAAVMGLAPRLTVPLAAAAFVVTHTTAAGVPGWITPGQLPVLLCMLVLSVRPPARALAIWPRPEDDAPDAVVRHRAHARVTLVCITVALCLGGVALAWAWAAGTWSAGVRPVVRPGMLLYVLCLDAARWSPRGRLPDAQGNTPPTLVLFDGVCGLCNHFVDALLTRDRAHRLRFAPLQGTTAAAYTHHAPAADTVIVVEGPVVLMRSDAAITALTRLGGLWSFAALLGVVPVSVRDAVYAFVARHRLAWFGTREACRLPTPAERAVFLP